jgi:IS4 transposase
VSPRYGGEHKIKRFTCFEQFLCLAFAQLTYRESLRDIEACPKTGKRLIFLTNNFALPALTITDLYRCRWQVELFFKWIKQHLRIKQFYGTSQNAVKTQIWIAVSVYVLVAIVKKRLNISASLYEMLQILSLTMFEKTSLNTLLATVGAGQNDDNFSNQLNLFN